GTRRFGRATLGLGQTSLRLDWYLGASLRLPLCGGRTIRAAVRALRYRIATSRARSGHAGARYLRYVRASARGVRVRNRSTASMAEDQPWRRTQTSTQMTLKCASEQLVRPKLRN